MKINFTIIFFFVTLFSYYSQNTKAEIISELIVDFISSKYSKEKLDNFIYIGIKRQKLYLFEANIISKIYKVSTSLKGAGNEMSSYKTPLGLHFIYEKIGNNAPIGTLFINKKNTNKIVEIDSLTLNQNKDEITTRLMSLMGKELNINKGGRVDTFKRGIYIHGTSNEKSIGKPSSHGCIRMKNNDIVELFNSVDKQIPVFLFNN
ncbi:MAG: hypothetical protein CL851_06200 [Crocinitomicaceae bacterium]|nr:hypothetical protein [Crocinitomicaceae bacterium]